MNKEKLQNYNDRLTENNISLETIKEKINELPDIPNATQLEITPTKEEQSFNGLYDSVTVNPIPDNYIEPTGTLEINSNGEHNVVNYEKVNVKVGGIPINDANHLFYSNARLDVVDELCALISDDCENFEGMFQSCSQLITAPQINTKNGTNFYNMFNSCRKMTSVPQLDVGNGTNFQYMLAYCNELTVVPPLNTDKGTNFNGMIEYSPKITTIEHLETSNGQDFQSFAIGCSALETVSMFDLGKAKYVNSMFTSQVLKNLGGFKDLGKGYTTKSANYFTYEMKLTSPVLTYESLMNVINNLYDLNLTYDVANGGTLYTQKLTIGETNLAKLTAEEIAIATNKGWTVS